MMTDMDLADFLAARWDEIAATAHHAGPARIAWLTYLDKGEMLYTTVAAQIHDEAPWVSAGEELPEPSSVRVVYDPAAVLADIAAKRKILAEHARAPWFSEDTLARWRTGGHVPEERIAAAAASASCARCHKVIPDAREDEDQCEHFDYPCPTVRLLAVPFAAHPDYDQAWRPQP
jgi:Family of unknown function (DUF6221)